MNPILRQFAVSLTVALGLILGTQAATAQPTSPAVQETQQVPGAGKGFSRSPGFRSGPPVCEVDATTTVNVGQVHQSCPGAQTAGGGCSLPLQCKRCEAGGSWGAEYRC